MPKVQPKYEGYKEYPKIVGVGENRKLVNDEFEEQEYFKEFPATEESEDDSETEKTKAKPASTEPAPGWSANTLQTPAPAPATPKKS